MMNSAKISVHGFKQISMVTSLSNTEKSADYVIKDNVTETLEDEVDKSCAIETLRRFKDIDEEEKPYHLENGSVKSARLKKYTKFKILFL